MKQLKFLLSLVSSESEYQRDQALQAEGAARRLGVALQIVYAQRDAINQSQQLLNVIQSKTDSKPDAIIFEPVSETGMPTVARAACDAGIGWGILNLNPAYLAELRASVPCITFGLGADHLEIGRIQGRQLAKLLPQGGGVLDSGPFGQRRGTAAYARPAGSQTRHRKPKTTKS
jgi:ABC-type sugar transport system substrate-binding protein